LNISLFGYNDVGDTESGVIASIWVDEKGKVEWLDELPVGDELVEGITSESGDNKVDDGIEIESRVGECIGGVTELTDV
jgi:hypothetical protein